MALASFGKHAASARKKLARFLDPDAGKEPENGAAVKICKELVRTIDEGK